ncbi:NAD(P)-dependent oxidoreductase [Pseudogracilibacillus auburnensis]|uniref:NAD(P)-dependent oxidoreductase n=1 Tax=Pseudogracilibacillus auburnensis TaxID=1494959 RepID=UPI001D39C174|nr:NAD(P)H-binding protein [Pseudogracilibacillus auburnensis]MBO1005023.1 NAD(P)H-binding protein [Pseudogracilibacillus auburnensis]
MTRLLLLGATGRTGNSILRQLSEHEHIQVTAAIRDVSDSSRLPKTKRPIHTTIVDIDDILSLRKATSEADIIVNAIRLRGNIPRAALVTLDKRIRESVEDIERRLIITVGGAGSLHTLYGQRFWQDSTFPKRTLPRGIAHAELRDYLEELPQASWAYLIPPPAYIPDGLRVGTYKRWKASNDEREFLKKSISYEDFATAVCDAVRERWQGVHLIAGVD